MNNGMIQRAMDRGFIFCPYCDNNPEWYARNERMIYSWHYAKYEGEQTGHRFVCEYCAAEFRFGSHLSKQVAFELAELLSSKTYSAEFYQERVKTLDKIYRTFPQPFNAIITMILANGSSALHFIPKEYNGEGRHPKMLQSLLND